MPCLKNTLTMKSWARSAKVQVTFIRIKIACLENQSITIGIESEDADVGRGSMKFIEIDSDKQGRMESCWRVL